MNASAASDLLVVWSPLIGAYGRSWTPSSPPSRAAATALFVLHHRSDDAVWEGQAPPPASFPTTFSIAATDALANRFWTRRTNGYPSRVSKRCGREKARMSYQTSPLAWSH